MKNVIVFENTREKMNVMHEFFMELLDTKVVKTFVTRDECLIETDMFKIRFKVALDGIRYDSVRGHKADIVINNTKNESLEEWIPSITNNSHYFKNWFL